MRSNVLICCMLMTFNVMAGKITMSNPDEQELQGGKRLCTYENSIYLFTYVTKGKCAYAKTFDTSDNEKD
ncbi:hypothetical protein DOX43_19190 [Cronobacter malonaticus]|nr:hypothetical protein [Cronobacter malonaticus]EGT4485740.1 hypothetical protein [Cronobacter malonaticus]